MDSRSPTTFNGDSPLHVAVRQGQIEDVREILIQQQIDVNILNSKHETPLHLACSKNDSPIVQLLVAFGADPFIKDSNNKNAYNGNGFDIGQLMNKLLFCHGLRLWIDGPVKADRDRPLHTAVRLERLDDIQRIIEMKIIDTNDTNANHETPLHLACAFGYKHIIRILISDGADIYKKDNFNNAPIHRAVSQGHIDTVDCLITDYACDPNIKGYQNRTLLHFACGTGNVKLVTALIEKYGISPMATDAVNQTPLHIAASHGQEEVVCLLIASYNLMVDCRSNGNLSPLHLACYCGRNMSVVRILVLEYKADIHIKFNGESDVFNNSVIGGYIEMLQLMITEFDLDPLSADDSGNTPLHIACQCGHEGLIRLLITKYNCPVDVRNKMKETPLHEASSFGHSSIVRMLISEFKADATQRDCYNDTAVSKAAVGGHVETVQALITELGCSPKVIGWNGRSLLHDTCLSGSIKLAEMLIRDFSLDVLLADDSGNTPLHIACGGGHEELARILITKYNCPVDIINIDKQTPLHLACSRGHLDVSIVLVSKCMPKGDKRFYNALDKDSNTTLDLSIKRGDAKAVHILYTEYGCKPHIRGVESKPLLHQLAAGGFSTMLHELISKFNYDPASSDEDGNTILHTAAQHGQYEIADILVTYHSNKFAIDHRNCRGLTALHYACMYGHARMVILIASKALEINDEKALVDDSGNTLLLIAAQHGQYKIAKLLFFDYSNQCPINHRNFQGQTALHCACIGGHTRVAKFLVANKADITIRDGDGDTPLKKAFLMGHEHTLFELLDSNLRTIDYKLLQQVCERGSVKLMDILLSDFHLDPSSVLDDQGNQVIHVAALQGHKQVITLLIKKYKCPVDSRGFKKRSLLHHALAKGHTSTAKTLIEDFHLSLHCVDEDGNTPLHLSSLFGQLESVRFLLYEYHAPVYVRNNAGKIALDLAMEDSTKKVIREYVKSENNRIQHEYEDLRAKSKQKYSGQQVITRVFVLGYPGSGKSTLVESLKRKGIISSLFSVTEADVPPHTAGIAPSVHQSKEAGRLLYYDFAGDKEYYSSHAAILEMISNLTIGSNIYFIVADLRKNIVTIHNELGYWLSFVAYHGKALDSQRRLKIIFILSHSDHLSSTDCVSKMESMRQYLHDHKNQCDEIFDIVEVVSSNCRWPRSTRSIESTLQQIFKNTPPCSISYEASLLHGILEKDFSNVVACKFQDLLSHIKDTSICLPTIADSLFPIVKELHDIGLLMMIGRSRDRLEDYLLLLNLSSLTHEVHRTLFSKSTMKVFHSSFGPQYANMGILPEGYLARLLPEHITKECLVQLQYCQEFTCADVGLNSSGVSNSAEKNLLYFPALCKLDSEQSNWPTDPLLNFSIGWYTKCTGKFDYFPARFLHVLLLRLAFTFALPIANCNISEFNEISAHNRRCTMWKNGIRWLMEEGVECIFQMVNDNKGIVVITKSEEGSKEWARILSEIINKTLQAKAEFCNTVSLYHFLLKSDDTSSFMNKDRLFEISEIERVIKEGKKKIVSVSGRTFLDSSHLNIFRKYTFGGLCNVEIIRTPSHGCEGEYDLEIQVQPMGFEQKLDQLLDFESGGVSTHLGQIADTMHEWEGPIAEQLGLTRADVAAIKTKHPGELKLQTREALEQWKQKSGLNATYRNLVDVFKAAGYQEYVETVYKLFR